MSPDIDKCVLGDKTATSRELLVYINQKWRLVSTTEPDNDRYGLGRWQLNILKLNIYLNTDTYISYIIYPVLYTYIINMHVLQ